MVHSTVHASCYCEHKQQMTTVFSVHNFFSAHYYHQIPQTVQTYSTHFHSTGAKHQQTTQNLVLRKQRLQLDNRLNKTDRSVDSLVTGIELL